MYYVSFDSAKFYPIVKEVSIRYPRPASTDLTPEVSLEPGEVEAIQRATQKEGKKDWTIDLELKDAHGEVCSMVHGTWQMRRFQENKQ